jgi:hypothetical protein
VYLILIGFGDHVAGQIIHTFSDDFIQRIHNSLGLLTREPFPFKFFDKPVGVKVVAAVVKYWDRGGENAD